MRFELKMIVEQLLVSAAISRGQSVIEEEVDVGRAVLDVILDYMPLAVENGRKIELDCPEKPIMTTGSRRAVESIVIEI